jgi:hypothetical protein
VTEVDVRVLVLRVREARPPRRGLIEPGRGVEFEVGRSPWRVAVRGSGGLAHVGEGRSRSGTGEASDVLTRSSPGIVNKGWPFGPHVPFRPHGPLDRGPHGPESGA